MGGADPLSGSSCEFRRQVSFIARVGSVAALISPVLTSHQLMDIRSVMTVSNDDVMT
jgi:hypothetical protein